MKRWIAALAMSVALSAAVCAPAFADDAPVALKQNIVVSGPLVTLGDLLDNAGAAGSRPIGPAPRAGARATFLPHVVENAARAAGLNWQAPTGLRVIEVHGGARGDALTPTGATPREGASPAIKRGDLVLLSFQAPGVRITARARALSDGAVGQPIRLANLQSNRPIDALVTGPGRASANFDHPASE